MSEGSGTLMVTGASGHLGTRVVELLLDRSAGHVIAGTRHPEKLEALAGRGAEVRRLDFEDPGSMRAFDGVERLLIVSTDAIETPGRRLAQQRAAVEAAAAQGVAHVVYTSMPHADQNTIVFFSGDHRGTEEALAATGMTFTVLRNNWYTDFLLMALAPAVAAGRLFSAAGDGGAAYITREDCARAAAAALSSTDRTRKVLELTGPEVVGFGGLARLAAEVSGRPVEWMPVEPEALRQGMVANGVPEVFADLTVQAQRSMKAGLMGPATTAFRDLTGRDPTPVADFLRANKAALLGS